MKTMVNFLYLPTFNWRSGGSAETVRPDFAGHFGRGGHGCRRSGLNVGRGAGPPLAPEKVGDTGPHVVSDLAHARDRLALRVLERPVVPAGRMPANVSLAERASVTAGFAKDVDEVN